MDRKKTHPPPEEETRFKDLLRKLVAVPKEEVRQVAEHQKKRKPRKPS